MKFVGVSEVRLVDDREINFRPSPLNIALESMPKLMPSGCFDRGISLCPRVCTPELLDEFQACSESTIAPFPYSFPYSFRINPRDARLPWWQTDIRGKLAGFEHGAVRFSSRNLDDFTTGKIFVYEVVTKIELKYSRDEIFRIKFIDFSFRRNSFLRNVSRNN